jgi:RNase H-fold protein (predicted Holliday junction resolvase)
MPLRSIGVDYGLVRTGIAVTTSGGYSPRPLAILTGYVNNSASLSSRILDLALSERASDIVLGLPLHKNGTHSEQSNITRSFGRYLARETGLRTAENRQRGMAGHNAQMHTLLLQQQGQRKGTEDHGNE